MRSTRGLVELSELLSLCRPAMERARAERQDAWLRFRQAREDAPPSPPAEVQLASKNYAAYSRADCRLEKLHRLRRRLLGELALLVMGHAALATVALSASFASVWAIYQYANGSPDGGAAFAAIPLALGSAMLLLAALGLTACIETREDTRWVEELQQRLGVVAARLAEIQGMATLAFWALILSATPGLARVLVHVIADRLRG